MLISISPRYVSAYHCGYTNYTVVWSEFKLARTQLNNPKYWNPQGTKGMVISQTKLSWLHYEEFL